VGLRDDMATAVALDAKASTTHCGSVPSPSQQKLEEALDALADEVKCAECGARIDSGAPGGPKRPLCGRCGVAAVGASVGLSKGASDLVRAVGNALLGRDAAAVLAMMQGAAQLALDAKKPLVTLPRAKRKRRVGKRKPRRRQRTTRSGRS
jgi:hypothetical protein